MKLPTTNGFNWFESIPYTNLDAIEGVDGYSRNLLTYDQLMANARLLATSRFKWRSEQIEPFDHLSEYI